MPDEIVPFASIRRRKSPSQLLRPSGNDNYLLPDDMAQSGSGGSSSSSSSSSSKRFVRWTACFGFVSKLKRPKSRLDFPLAEKLESHHQLSTPSPPLSVAGPRSPLECSYPLSEWDQQEEGSSVSALPPQSWKDKPIPLQPASPPSALSPPPRHAMKERSLSMSVDNTVPWSTSSSPLTPKEKHQESFPQPMKQKANTIGPSLALRLSWDVEQQYPSSLLSTGDLHKKDEQDDVSSGTSPSRVRGAVAPDSTLQPSSIEMSTNSSPSPGAQQVETRLSLIERRQRNSATIPDIEKLTISYNENDMDDVAKYGDEEEDDYQNLLSRFRLPSEGLPPPSSSSAAAFASEENQEKKKEGYQHWNNRPPIPFGGTLDLTSRETSRQQAMNALEGIGSGVRPMDVVRDKAYYDAVVAGTLHRRPWTQYLRTQPAGTRDDQEDLLHDKGGRYIKTSSVALSKHHRPSMAYFPPSPNSLNSQHEA